MSLIRHFTATGFVVHNHCLALHWHPKVQAWLPPGGHIDENEDPVQAVLREITEETGLSAEVVDTESQIHIDYPTQVQVPLTIMVEDIHDPVEGYHQHIDMIYVCRAISPVGPVNAGWQWVSRADLYQAVPLWRADGFSEPPPEDVRILAERAFQLVEKWSVDYRSK